MVSGVSMAAASDKEEHAGGAELGERVRRARAKVGMTRRRLADASGTSERYLAHIEAGVANPSMSILTSIAESLDISLADLLPQGGERSRAYMEAAAALRRLSAEGLEAFNSWIHNPVKPTASKGRRVLMLGLRGAGKSSLGKDLAGRLEVPFLEVSKEVESAYGADIGLLIELSGQAALRRYESEVWESIIQQNESAVIAAPGGVVADASIYERMLTTSHSVWLEAMPEDHMKRVMAQGDFRPMASNRGAMADLQAILRARASEYSRADAHLNTSEQGFSETLRLLEGIARRLIDRNM
jgi:XRE family aerobic/anaerobic benzoate catabolism transcriptional regulator